jgi:hypothetical protein
MNNAERFAAYTKQNGTSRLTASQRRRMAHKDGHRAARFARQLADVDEALSAVQETFGDYGPVPMPCGTCGAINDEPCTRPSGRKLKEPHKGRE